MFECPSGSVGEKRCDSPAHCRQQDRSPRSCLRGHAWRKPPPRNRALRAVPPGAAANQSTRRPRARHPHAPAARTEPQYGYTFSAALEPAERKHPPRRNDYRHRARLANLARAVGSQLFHLLPVQSSAELSRRARRTAITDRILPEHCQTVAPAKGYLILVKHINLRYLWLALSRERHDVTTPSRCTTVRGHRAVSP